MEEAVSIPVGSAAGGGGPVVAVDAVTAAKASRSVAKEDGRPSSAGGGVGGRLVDIVVVEAARWQSIDGNG